MADLELNEIPVDSAGANIARDDEVLIKRGGAPYKAKLDGDLLLPAFTAEDAGKRLEIDDAGRKAWVKPANQNTITLVHTSTINPTGPYVVPNFNFNDYSYLRVQVELTNTQRYGSPVMPLLNVATQTATTGLEFWFPTTASINWSLPSGFSSVRYLYIYGISK